MCGINKTAVYIIPYNEVTKFNILLTKMKLNWKFNSNIFNNVI